MSEGSSLRLLKPRPLDTKGRRNRTRICVRRSCAFQQQRLDAHSAVFFYLATAGELGSIAFDGGT